MQSSKQIASMVLVREDVKRDGQTDRRRKSDPCILCLRQVTQKVVQGHGFGCCQWMCIDPMSHLNA